MSNFGNKVGHLDSGPLLIREIVSTGEVSQWRDLILTERNLITKL